MCQLFWTRWTWHPTRANPQSRLFYGADRSLWALRSACVETELKGHVNLQERRRLAREKAKQSSLQPEAVFTDRSGWHSKHLCVPWQSRKQERREKVGLYNMTHYLAVAKIRATLCSSAVHGGRMMMALPGFDCTFEPCVLQLVKKTFITEYLLYTVFISNALNIAYVFCIVFTSTSKFSGLLSSGMEEALHRIYKNTNTCNVWHETRARNAVLDSQTHDFLTGKYNLSGSSLLWCFAQESTTSKNKLVHFLTNLHMYFYSKHYYVSCKCLLKR